MLQRTGFKRKTYERPPPAPLKALTRPVNPVHIEDTVTAIPKQPRAVNRHLLSMARDRLCLLRSPRCVGGTETTVACHGAGVENGKGTGYKVGDHMSAWGCWACNDYTDAYIGATKAQKRAVFMAGMERQIVEWKRIAADPAEPARDRLAAQWALEQHDQLEPA